MRNFSNPPSLLRRLALILLTIMSLYANARETMDPAADRAVSEKQNSRSQEFRLAVGKGYTICEAYFKHLKAMPKESEPRNCEIWFDPKRSNFVRPQWEVLNVLEHLDIVRNIEGLDIRNEPGRPRSSIWLDDFPTFKDEPPMPSPDEVGWRERYAALVKRNKLSPQLLRMRLTLYPGYPEETVFAYRRFSTSLCQQDGNAIDEKWTAQEVGFRHYLLRDDGMQVRPAFEGMVGTAQPGEIMLFRDKPFMFSLIAEPRLKQPEWELQIKALFAVRHDSGEPGYGASLHRCTYRYYEPIHYHFK